MTRHISSEKARANWRAILDAVEDGETIVIERYGRPVATLSPSVALPDQAVPIRLNEPSPTYQTLSLEEFKQDIVAEVLASLDATEDAPGSWHEELEALRASIAAQGGLDVGETTEEIVEHMRRTRQEIWDAEYAHLYR